MGYRTGDAGIEYLFTTTLVHLLFSLSMIIVCIVIARAGGFNWISPHAAFRNGVIIVSLSAILFTIYLSSVAFSNEVGIMKMAAAIIPIVLPLPLLAASVILLNKSLYLNVSIAVWKTPLIILAGISVLVCAVMLVMFIGDQQKNAKNKLENTQNQANELHQESLEQIKNTDVLTSLVFLLGYTNQYQDDNLRKAALAKIKTNPKWQQELIRLLRSGWASQVFIFLADNEVEDKKIFAEPVNDGIINMAEYFRKNINQTLFPELFEAETQNVLGTVEKFKNLGVDYMPALKKMREALNYSNASENDPKLNCISILDQWIKAHE